MAADSLGPQRASAAGDRSGPIATTEPLPYEITELSPQRFARLAGFITGELGIKMPECKLTMVQSRLLRRVRELGMKSVDQYCEHLLASSQSEEREHFINAITTNKTDFFREPEHFDLLTRYILPELARSHRGVSYGLLKAWSVGCSSGQEPYTLAMVLSEYALAHPRFDFTILATDVSTRVLDKAKTAIYPEAEIQPVPREIRARYLLRSRNEGEPLVRIVPALRSTVSFHRLNLMEGDYRLKDMFELIFFRNVLIYFEKETQEAVVNRICRNLVPGGYLFVGHSESLSGLDVPVKPVKTSVFRKPLD